MGLRGRLRCRSKRPLCTIITKAHFLASLGVFTVATDLGDAPAMYLAASETVNAPIARVGLATVGISPGTVVGGEIKHGATMVGFHREFLVPGTFPPIMPRVPVWAYSNVQGLEVGRLACGLCVPR